MAECIRVENVTKRFGDVIALDRINISFESGKIYGIIGRNGSGKTVLFKTMIGYLKPTSGRVVVGLIVFVLLIFQYYRMTCGALSRENKKENKVLLIAAISSVTGFMVQSMSDYTFYNYRVMLLFWVCIGFGMVLTKLYRLKEE